MLDIDASKDGNRIDEFTIAEIASECFMPLTVGGGLKTIKDISLMLSKGADKVVLNSIALKTPDFITEAAKQFGSQCIVISVDVKKDNNNNYQIYSHAGISCDLSVDDWIRKIEELGAGEILINNVDLDGKMSGFDLKFIESVTKKISLPVIIAGGAQKPEDFPLAISSGVSAVSAASIFHFTSITPDDCKNSIEKFGYEVRK